MNTESIIDQYLEIAQEALEMGILTNIVDGTNFPDEDPYFSIKWKDGKIDTVEYTEYNQEVVLYEDIQSSPADFHNDNAITLEDFKQYLMNPVTMEESFVIEEKYQKADGFGPYDGYQNHDDKKAYQAKLDREKSDRDNNLTESEKIITIKVDDVEGSLEDMLKHIQTIGNTGHSFSIDVDPDGEKDQHRLFDWDGDGGDYIEDITVERLDDDDKDKLTESSKKIVIEVDEDEGNLEGMLTHIKNVGNAGNRITVDITSNGNDKKIFNWDGDGGDTIKDIRVNKLIEQQLNEAPLDDLVMQYNKAYLHARKIGDADRQEKLKKSLLIQFQRAGRNWEENPTAVEILTENRIIKIARQSNNMVSYKENLKKYFDLIGSKKYFSELLADGNQLGIRNIKDDEGLENEIFKRLKGPKKQDTSYYKNQADALEKNGFKREAAKMRDKIQMAIDNTLDESVKDILRAII